MGGQPDLPLKIEAPDEEVWEKSIHATCECLAWRGIWNAEMRRRTETDLGQTLYSGVPYYGRWVLAAAHQLIVGNHITQDELRDKMVEIRRRLEEQSGEV